MIRITFGMLCAMTIAVIWIDPVAAGITSNFSQDSLYSIDLEKKIDSLLASAIDLAKSRDAEIIRVEEIYGKTIDHILELAQISLAVVSVVVIIIGVGIPLIIQRQSRNALKEMIDKQSEAFRQELTSVHNTLQHHSEKYSLALTNYALGAVSLDKAKASPDYILPAFANFVKCLSALTELGPSHHLPMIYEVCLLSITEFTDYQWRLMPPTDLEVLSRALLFLKREWKDHPQIQPHVDKIEEWLNSPADKGDEISGA